MVYIYRWISLDNMKLFTSGSMTADGNLYISFATSSSVDMMDLYTFAQIKDDTDKDLFFTNTSVKWMSGPSGAWYSHNGEKGSGIINTHSDLRLSDIIDWDAMLDFTYGDSKYNIVISDYSSKDHTERFMTYGHGQYGGDLNSWLDLYFILVLLLYYQ